MLLLTVLRLSLDRPVGGVVTSEPSLLLPWLPDPQARSGTSARHFPLPLPVPAPETSRRALSGAEPKTQLSES